MAFNFKTFGSTPETSLVNNTRIRTGNSVANNNKQEYTGLGSSVINFGKDIAQGIYLAFGGQKKIDDITKQYLDNAGTLTKLATEQKDPELRKKYIKMAEGMIDDARNVGGSIIGKTRSSKQIIGDALGTLGWTLVGGTPTFKATAPLVSKTASTVGSRLSFGTAFGAGAGAQKALSQEKSGIEIGKEALIGGATGLAISGVIEGISAGLRALSKTKLVQKRAGRIFTSELQPSTKDLTTQIEKNWQEIGDKIIKQVDDAGNPIYKGGYETMKKQAQEQIIENSSKLKQVIKRIISRAAEQGDDITVNRKGIEKFVLDNLESEFILNKAEKGFVAKQIARLPKSMNLLDVLDKRQLIDSEITPSFWSKLGSGDKTSMLDTIRYWMRTYLKEQLEQKAGSEVVNTLNKKIGLAMDVRHLTALQEAIRVRGSIPGSSRYLGIGKIIGNLLDKTIFSPEVRTRQAQNLIRMGQKSGSTLGRNILTTQITNPIIE